MRSRYAKFVLTALPFAAVSLWVACGGYSSSPTNPSPTPSPAGSPAADVTITINGMNGSQSFSPNPASVRVGQTVAWRNADSISHTATADRGGFNTGTLAPGATSAPVTVSTAGTAGYHCQIHPEMVGTLNVTQ